MQTSGGAPLCFAPPSLLSPEEEPMDIGTIHLTPHPKNENTEKKGLLYCGRNGNCVASCTKKAPAVTVIWRRYM